jgi:hypothetical protein
MPTFSFRITIESRVVNNGAAKPSAVAEPSDSTLTAMNQHSIEPNWDRQQRVVDLDDLTPILAEFPEARPAWARFWR